MRTYFDPERRIAAHAQALPVVPRPTARPMHIVSCRWRSSLHVCVGWTSALPWRRIQSGLLDSHAVPRHSLAGMSVAFLTWPTTANLFWTA